jgi:hypothetical protein
MVLVTNIFLMDYHPRAEVFGYSLPRRKDVRLPGAFVGKIFHQDAGKMSEWESVIDRSKLLFYDAVVALCLWHVLLSCRIVHRDGRVELCY